MGVLQSIAAQGATLSRARFVVGTSGQVMDELARVAGTARSTINAELFGLSDEVALGAINAAAARGVRVALHADDEALALGRYASAAENPAIALTSHGAMPIKLHTKALVADSTTGYVGTAAPVWELRKYEGLDVAAVFDGPAVQALERLTVATAAGKSKAVRSAAEEAARHGIFVNDPIHGVKLLRERVGALIDSATDSLYVGTKVLEDSKMIDRLARAQQRGVRVLIEANPMTEAKWVERARAAGLNTRHLPKVPWRIHANTVIADGREAYVGSATISKRGMARSYAGRPAREMGFVTSDPEGLRQVIEGFASVTDSSLASFLRMAT